jgi:hypothetical protein
VCRFTALPAQAHPLRLGLGAVLWRSIQWSDTQWSNTVYVATAQLPSAFTRASLRSQAGIPPYASCAAAVTGAAHCATTTPRGRGSHLEELGGLRRHRGRAIASGLYVPNLPW